jgi:hypothetical protein
MLRASRNDVRIWMVAYASGGGRRATIETNYFWERK